jgi:hypothetical protein
MQSPNLVSQLALCLGSVINPGSLVSLPAFPISQELPRNEVLSAVPQAHTYKARRLLRLKQQQPKSMHDNKHCRG